MSIRVSYRTTLACDGGGAGHCEKASKATFESPSMAATIRAAIRSGWSVNDLATCPFC